MNAGKAGLFLIVLGFTARGELRGQSMASPDDKDQVIQAMSFDARANAVSILAKGVPSATVHPQDEICMQIEPGVPEPIFGKKREDRRRRVAKFRSVSELTAFFGKTATGAAAPGASASVGGQSVQSVVFEKSSSPDVYSVFVIQPEGAEVFEISQDLLCLKLDSRAAKPVYTQGQFRSFLVFPSVESLSATIVERDMVLP